MDETHFRIRGVWTSRYWLQLTPTSTPFDLNYLLVQTNDIGCCYLPRGSSPVQDPRAVIGASVFDDLEHPGLQIAALDAAYGALPRRGDVQVLSGENWEKAVIRARVICEEVRRLLPDSQEKAYIGLVGVVGEILHEMRNWPDVELRATDFAPGLAGGEMDGIEVDWGSQTEEMIASVDVAVVTGMTLANGSLDEIIRVAGEASTRLVVFAETGHNFGSKYLQLGIDTVVAEEFPFYLTAPGQSRIRVGRVADQPLE